MNGTVIFKTEEKMVHINPYFKALKRNYLFAEIGKRVKSYQDAHPDKEIIKLGIGDVTQGIPPACVQAMQQACGEIGKKDAFKGYGDYEGYLFLREKITASYKNQGVSLNPDEIFINDGAKADTANIINLFANDTKIALCDPVYPVYLDSNILSGRAGIYNENRWSNVVYLPCVAENNFIPDVPKEPVDLIYLCFPNNPTGAMVTKDVLQRFVDYALKTNAVILYDAAYEAYITEDLPHSVFVCEGAENCAIEFKSFSKDAGFTGVRSGYTVIPSKLERDGLKLRDLWLSRQAIHYNGASYITQCGAAACFSEEGQKQIKDLIDYYMQNAKIILDGLKSLDFEVYGGVNSPYIWLKTPNKMDSWGFFDYLLENIQVVGTPGVGFGPSGAGYFRLTDFNTHEKTLEAIKRFKKL